MNEALFRSVRTCIRLLRRCRDADIHWPELQRIVGGNLEEIAQTFSVRWIVSICDTFVDYGGPVERRNAMLVSQLVNMVRVADTIRLIHGPLDDGRIAQYAQDDAPRLFSGVRGLHLEREDGLLNQAKRLTVLLDETPVILRLYHAVLSALHDSDNSLTELARLSKVPERMFPQAPLDLADNYGTTRHPCEGLHIQRPRRDASDGSDGV